MNAPLLSQRARHALPVISRIAAAIGGGYVFCWGFIALGLSGLYAAGMSFHDAEHLSAIVGVLLFLVVFCWAFGARSIARVWLVLLLGGGFMSGLAALTQHALV
ncbi:iron uptake protein [Roseateles aquatilis]|uniref:Iron uptake protein n=1 Tax=Roseateles aquatilis TaxID=431061 RepID=A0A246JDY9_9BURK|nr:iron uptake protein [Roseateles aquatilis]OWQ90804.1 iron uptake protein [Roseateles aquatilis]